MTHFRLSVLFLFVLFSQITIAQHTVGIISYDPVQTFDGYNLYFPHHQGSIYLINNCGQLVHKWEDDVYVPGNGVYLRPEGVLYTCKSRGSASNAIIHAGGGGELVRVLDWDNNVNWEFSYNDATKRMHHDIAVMPNGNVLILAWELKTSTEALAAGRDTTTLSSSAMWPEHIIEVDTATNNIVWEWHAWDHLIQDFDNTKANYGVVKDHPELIDINFDNSNGSADWMHANAIDYNADLDQIVLSIPTFNEFWIIDHSTTSAQAAGHSGGLSGRGGDLMYRFGNPAAYGVGDSTLQQLFYQHHVHWVDQGLNSSHTDYGKIALYNNRIGEDYSEVAMLAPVFDSYEWEYPMTDSVWGPSDFDWTYRAPVPQDMYSNILSSMQRLENGNTLIGIGRPGRAIEINPSGDIVWEYVNPLNFGVPVSQGDVVAPTTNMFFRMNRYAADYEGFDGRDLSQVSYIEMNPDTLFCDMFSAIDDDAAQPVSGYQIHMYPNPASTTLNIQLPGVNTRSGMLRMYDSQGRLVRHFQIQTAQGSETHIQIPIRELAEGMYLVRFENLEAGRLLISH